MKVLVKNYPAFKLLSEAIAYTVAIEFHDKIYRAFEASCEMTYLCDDEPTGEKEFEVVETFELDNNQFVKISIPDFIVNKDFNAFCFFEIDEIEGRINAVIEKLKEE